MSGQRSGPLPDIPTRWTTVQGEVGGTGPSCNAARGSWEYDGESARVLLGATAEEINQKDCEVLSWMSAVQGAAYTSPPPGNLPRDRTEGQTPFQVIGVDFAGPLRYRKKPKTEGKAYILLYACTLTRAVYVDLVPNLETTGFIRSLKCFIAPRGRPRRIYSDNAKTFVSGSKWIEKVMKDEKISGSSPSRGLSGNSI